MMTTAQKRGALAFICKTSARRALDHGEFEEAKLLLRLRKYWLRGNPSRSEVREAYANQDRNWRHWVEVSEA